MCSKYKHCLDLITQSFRKNDDHFWTYTILNILSCNDWSHVILKLGFVFLDDISSRHSISGQMYQDERPIHVLFKDCNHPHQCPGSFWAYRVGQRSIVILNLTGYMLTSSGFPFSYFRYILYIPLRWPVSFLKSWTSTGYFSNSTGSSATNHRIFPDIDPHVCFNGFGKALWTLGPIQDPYNHRPNVVHG